MSCLYAACAGHAGIMGPGSTGPRTYNTFSFKKESLKAGMALLFKAKGAAGYANATTWTDAVKHVKYVQNPSGPPRRVITFPAADDFVHIDYLKLDWTMSAGSLGTASSVR